MIIRIKVSNQNSNQIKAPKKARIGHYDIKTEKKWKIKKKNWSKIQVIFFTFSSKSIKNMYLCILSIVWFQYKKVLFTLNSIPYKEVSSTLGLRSLFTLLTCTKTTSKCRYQQVKKHLCKSIEIMAKKKFDFFFWKAAQIHYAEALAFWEHTKNLKAYFFSSLCKSY